MALVNARLLAFGGAVAATLALLIPAVAGATPATAPRTQPSVADVEKTLGTLALQNSQLVEKYNQATIATGRAKAAAATAQARADQASAGYQAARRAYVAVVQSQYEGAESLGAAGALLESQSDSEYLQRINAMGVLSSHVTQVLDRVEGTHAAAATAVQQAADLYAAAKKTSDALAAQRNTVNAQIAKYRQLLSTLNSQQQQTYLRAANPSVAVSAISKQLPVAASANAKAAVAFALSQVGKPYVFGAAGPDSYDCSGLTMRAWQAGGVSLPHSAADQYNYGTHVSLSQLSPGDLIFMYQPIGHVTIYIGDGYMVSAPTEGEDVTVIPVSAFDGQIVGATHIG